MIDRGRDLAGAGRGQGQKRFGRGLHTFAGETVVRSQEHVVSAVECVYYLDLFG